MTKQEAVKALEDHRTQLAELNKKVDEQERTIGELEERADKWQDELKKAHEALIESRRVAVHADGSTIAIPPDADFAKGHEYLVRAARSSRSGRETKAIDALQNSDLGRYKLMNDALVVLGGGAKAPSMPKALRAVKQSPLWHEFVETGERLGLAGKAAYDTTEDSSWVPTMFSSELIEPIRDTSRLMGLFRRVPMPTKNFTLPSVTAERSVYIASEQTTAIDDSSPATRVTSSKATAGSVSLVAAKLGTRAVYSIEMLQNATFDFAVWVVGDIARALGEHGIDAAIMNGDDTSAHQDVGQAHGASDAERVWKGLRKLALAGSLTTSGATWSEAAVATARGDMGQFGGFSGTSEGPATAMLPSYKAFSLMQNFTNIVPSYAYGPRPGVLTGEAAVLFGMPVIPTEHMYTSLDANGVDASAVGTKTGAILVHRPGFLMGELRDIDVRSSDELYMETDQVVTVGFWQGDFEPTRTVGSSNPMVNYIINI